MHAFISDLRREHGEIITLLKILSCEVHRISGDKVPNYKVMHDILFYMTRYPDLFHHPKEELLFEQLLELTSDPEAVIEDLRGEHVSIADKGAKLLDLLRSVISDQVVSQEEVFDACSDYVRGQRWHITKEETQVFHLAERFLSDDDWKALDQRVAVKFDAFTRELNQRYARLFREICSAAGPLPDSAAT